MRVELVAAAVNGRVMRYAQAGDPASGSVLVLIHGFPLGVQMWAPQFGHDGLSTLAPSWRILAPALPGFDGSDSVEDPSVKAYGAHLFHWLDQLRVDRAVFAGLSLGGYLAFELVRQQSDRISALILADTRSTADNADVRKGRLAMRDAVAADGVAGIAGGLADKLLGHTTRTHHPDVAAAVREMIEKQTPSAVSDGIDLMLTRPDSGAVLPRIRVRTLIVVGAEDTVTPPSDAESLHAAIRGSQLTRIPGAGHLSNLEAPQAFNEAVASFLRTLRS